MPIGNPSRFDLTTMARRVMRRVRQVFIRDWLEIWLTALGVLFLGLALLFLVALGIVIANWGQPPPPELSVGRGLFQVNKGAGIAVFAVGAMLFTTVGWSLAGSSIRARVRQMRGEQRPPTIPPKEPRSRPDNTEARAR